MTHTGKIGTAVVAVAALALVLAKQPWRPSAANAQRPDARSVPRAPAIAAASIVLFADPREADAPCGCGDIIRAVRTAAAQGVSVREVAPGTAPELAQRYRVLVMPTVLVLGPRGEERARFEGESSATIEALRARLRALPGGRS